MNLKIRTKLSLSFSIILVLFLANILINMSFLRGSDKNITHINDISYKQLQYSSAINVSVIEVQQFLSDASATKNTDSLKEAESQRDVFKENIKKLQNINPEMNDKITKTDQDFDKFYDMGVNMARVYIDKGYEEGNVLMEQFDPMAVDLSKEIKELNTASEESMTESLKSISWAMNLSVIISSVLGVISFIIAIVVIILLGRGITIPINNMLRILSDLEKGTGDLTKRIDIKSRDEIGKMSSSFNSFIASLDKMIGNIKNHSDSVAGNSGDLNKVGIKTSSGISEINSAMQKLNNESQSITDSINQVTISIGDIAEASSTAAGSAQEICTKAVEIDSIAKQGGKAALDAKLEMDKIKTIASNTMLLNEKLGSRADEIEKITETIKAITDQTNLLALNASIEAARAGEHGRGFGVVAEEIRKLAENNSGSAVMIENLIKSIHEMINDTINSTNEVAEKIKQGSYMVEDVYNQLDKIIQGVGTVNDSIQSIAATSEEQSATTQELAATFEAINSNNKSIASEINGVLNEIQSQADSNNQLSEMAFNLNSSAKELDNLVGKFKISGGHLN